MNAPKHYTIREIADEFGLTYRALRFYEQKGLITPHRVYFERRYDEKHRERLREIVTLTEAGFTLAEIKAGPISLDAKREQLAHLRMRKDEIERAIAMLAEQVAAFALAVDTPAPRTQESCHG